MKQITTITAIFLINGLCLSSAAADKPIPFAGGLNQGGNEEKKEFGAPNKVSKEGQSEEKQGRIANRQPNPHLGRGGEESKPGTGGGQKAKGPNDHEKEELTRPAVVPKGGPLYNDPEVAEAIGLTEQQAEELRKVHEFAIKRCGEVMGNPKLTEEQKQREIDGIHATQKARRAEILTAEQLAALEKLHKGAKEYEEQQAGKKGSGSSGKPSARKKTKEHFSQAIRRNNQDSKGAKRTVSIASVLGAEKEKEILEIRKRCRGQMIEASQSCHSQIVAAEESAKAAILALEESTKASILAIKEDPELEAEDKKLQIAEIKAEAKLQEAKIKEETQAKYAEIIAEKNQKFATAETERESALGQQLGEEEYEAFKEIRVHNAAVREQRERRGEKQQKPKLKGGTNSKGRPEKGAGFEKRAKEYEEMAEKMRSEGQLDQAAIYSKLARIKWAGAKRGKLTEEELKQYHNLREQLAKLKKGGTDSKGRPEKGDTDSKGRPGNDEGNKQAKKFPPHWGKPPALQTKDLVKLPGNFGKGSSTLARWIEEHMEADAKKRQGQGGLDSKGRPEQGEVQSGGKKGLPIPDGAKPVSDTLGLKCPDGGQYYIIPKSFELGKLYAAGAPIPWCSICGFASYK